MKARSFTLVFGLTADPIHKGHEQVIINSFTFAETHQIDIKEFLLVPTYQPNLIADKKQPRTAYFHRYNMCELVASKIRIKFNYPLYVSDIEKQLFHKSQQKNYSYDTLNAIPANNKLFVLSADHFAGRWPKFRKWHRWLELVKENGLLIHQRPGNGINVSFIKQLKDLNSAVFVVKGMPSIDISSTLIRNKLKNAQSLSPEYISESIKKYCIHKQIY